MMSKSATKAGSSSMYTEPNICRFSLYMVMVMNHYSHDAQIRPVLNPQVTRAKRTRTTSRTTSRIYRIRVPAWYILRSRDLFLTLSFSLLPSVSFQNLPLYSVLFVPLCGAHYLCCVVLCVDDCIEPGDAECLLATNGATKGMQTEIRTAYTERVLFPHPNPLSFAYP